jgi:Heat shock protein
MAATKMACMESMDIENQFLKILSEVNAYQVAADSLTLYTDQKNESLTFSLTHFN